MEDQIQAPSEGRRRGLKAESDQNGEPSTGAGPSSGGPIHQSLGSHRGTHPEGSAGTHANDAPKKWKPRSNRNKKPAASQQHPSSDAPAGPSSQATTHAHGAAHSNQGHQDASNLAQLNVNATGFVPTAPPPQQKQRQRQRNRTRQRQGEPYTVEAPPGLQSTQHTPAGPGGGEPSTTGPAGSSRPPRSKKQKPQNRGTEGGSNQRRGKQDQPPHHHHNHHHHDDGVLIIEPTVPAEELPQCLVCCSPMTLVSVGECNHKDVCSACCLRLRVGYDRIDCPLCKTELKKVVIAQWRPDLPEYSFFLEHPEATAACSDGRLGRGTVLVDRWQPDIDRPRPEDALLHHLLGSVALACKVCDPAGTRPFKRPGQLETHLTAQHRSHLCGVCLREGHSFPLELELFPSKGAMNRHIAATHPECKFCRGRPFYNADALYHHMHQTHFRCYVCSPGPDGPYFNTAADLRQHMSDDHFPCDHPDCAAALVAFNTPDALRTHVQEVHLGRMPRWDASRARPLHLDIQFSARAVPPRGARGDRGRSQRGDRDRGGEEYGSRRRGFDLETEGGTMVVDDDLGLVQEAFPGLDRDRDGRRRGGGSFMSGTAWQGGRQGGRAGFRPEEEFPSLETVAPAPAAAAATSLPRLVKHRLKCPCGRRVSHFVVEEGQEVPELECDALCQLEGRRSQIADAFGVDPNHHINVFDRRNAVYSGALLAAAKKDIAWIKSIEHMLADFIADVKAQRRSLPPMTRSQRGLVHDLAAQYGLATVSQGQEPRRGIELLKASQRPTLPSHLLSQVAPKVSDEEIAAMLKEAEGYALKFVDIAMSVDVRYYLKRWEGHIASIEWPTSDSAVVRFEKESDRKEVLDAFGGGIRGLFKIERDWQPKTSVSAAGGGASSSSSSRSAWGADGEEAGGSWTAVAASAPAPHGGRGYEEYQEEQREQGPKGWAVIGNKRGARVVGSSRPPPVTAFEPAPVQVSNSMAALQIE